MANRRANRPSIVEWDRIEKFWRRKSQKVAQYINTFFGSHRNFEFTVAQIYHGLYSLGITCEQYDTIKREIEGKTGCILPDINCTDMLRHGTCDVRKKSFRNKQECQRYMVTFVQENNRKLVKEKRDQVKVHYEKIEKMFKEPGEKTIVSFDLEVYEYDHDKVQEIGFVVVRLSSGAPVITEKCHFIVEENLKYVNNDFVKDNRNGFRFGQSQTVPLEKAMEEFRRAVKSSAFLVAHSASDDDDYLKGIGLDLSELKKEIADTQMIELHKGFRGSSYSGDRIMLDGLKKLLGRYSVVYREADFHNAGCDAYYTMKVFLRQMDYSTTIVTSL